MGMTNVDPREAPLNQVKIITTRTRLNVTTCLYLSPSNRARSLSTLIAADVDTDTQQRITPETHLASKMERRAFQFKFVKRASMSVT